MEPQTISKEAVAGLVCDEKTQAQTPPAERGEHGNDLAQPDLVRLDGFKPDRDAPSTNLPEILQPHLVDRLPAERYGREYLEPVLRKDEAAGKQA